MRVTRTVREYIEREVTARVFQKYEAEKAEAERQQAILEEIRETVNCRLAQAVQAFVPHLVGQHNFLEVELTEHNMPTLGYKVINIVGRYDSDSVHGWRSRAQAEARRVADEIIVELELGGSKADLLAMLEQI